jgi:transposase
VSVEVFSQALAELAQFLGLGPDKHLILVLDQAGWHTSDRVVVPEGIHLIFQPAYSPELQPAERLWAVTDEALVNTHFDTIDELVDAQEEQCVNIRTRQEDICSRMVSSQYLGVNVNFAKCRWLSDAICVLVFQPSPLIIEKLPRTLYHWWPLLA